MKLLAALSFGLLLIGTAPHAQAGDALQRLFTTAAERDELDRRREQGVSEAEAPTAQADRLKVNGYIVRQDGKNVVWINKQSTLKGDSALTDVRVDGKGISQQRVPVHLPEGKVNLKPGQVYARGVGTITESYLIKEAPTSTGKDADRPTEEETNDAVE